MRPDSRWLLRKQGHEVALFHLAGRCCAVEESSPHAVASLALGRLEGTMLSCYDHGLRFDLAGGGAPGIPECRPEPIRYVVQDGRIQIDVTPSAQQAGGPN